MHTLPNLPPSIAHEVFATLCASLPPPLTDTQESRATRDAKAIAAIAALHPADAFEADLAAQIVATTAHAMDCLRLARQPGQDADAARRHFAQASTMMRHMQSGLRALHRIQAKREKAEAALRPETMERAGNWVPDVSVPAPLAQPEGPQPEPATLSDAEQYAVIYPDRAAIIRANRGLPARLDFGPPEPDIVDAIVHGTSPILRAFDHPPGAAAA